MSGASDDSRTNQWLRDAIEFRRAISDALISLPDEYPNHTSIAFSEFHEDAQKFLFEYYSMFEPAKYQLGSGGQHRDGESGDEDGSDSLWEAGISVANIPVSGHIRLGTQTELLENGKSDRDILYSINDQIPTQRVGVSLANLRTLYQSGSLFQVNLEGWIRHQGPVTRTILDKRHMSPKLIYDVRLQLDKCLAKTGKVPTFTDDARPYNDWREEFEGGEYTGPGSVDLPHKDAEG